MTPIINTHVHVPPNFSAFTTPGQVVQAARLEGVRVMGMSNFYDQQVYALMRDLFAQAQIIPLYGLEFITVVPDLEARGIRVNDPSNPGRMYLTGKGMDPFRTPTDRAMSIAAEIRRGNDSRAEQMVANVAAHFAASGCDTGLDAAAIITQVATRNEVDEGWVSLQERHIARAFQEAVSALEAGEAQSVLEKAYGSPATANLGDTVAVQAEIRSRLLKVGSPGFTPEVPLSFEDAYSYIVDMGGIPCYPILADGCNPVCPFEENPAALAQEILRRGIYAAELIPIRNHSAVVDDYVRTLREAGLIVMAGTEHNTLDQIPLDPTCIDGPMSSYARESFFDATCVVVAHADRVSKQHVGYVDSMGALAADGPRVKLLIEEGKSLVGQL